jgi:hypothetical protein
MFWKWIKRLWKKLTGGKEKVQTNTSKDNKISGKSSLNQVNVSGKSSANINSGGSGNTYYNINNLGRDVIINNSYREEIKKTRENSETLGQAEKSIISEKDLKPINNFVFDGEIFTLLKETKEMIEYEWPKGVISSEEATWSFRKNNDFYSLMNEYSRNDDKSEFENKLFVDGQWVKRKKDLYVKMIGRHPGVFNSWEEYTEYKGRKKANKVEKIFYYLAFYKENDLKIKTLYLTSTNGTNPTKFQPENKNFWKGELERLSYLWSRGKLFFENKSTEKSFFKEYNKFVKDS